MEEGTGRGRLSAGGGAHRALAAGRSRDEGVARDTGRREARGDPRSGARLAAEGALPALVLPAAYPRAHAAVAQRRRHIADAVPTVAGQYRLPRLRRSRPQTNARGLTRTIVRSRATWRP